MMSLSKRSLVMLSIFLSSFFIFYAYQKYNHKNEMQVHVCLKEYFKVDPVSTEATAYKTLIRKPLEKNVTYVAVPWTVLLNNNMLHRVPSFRVKNGFTICQHIHFEKIIQMCKDRGIDTLFTPHVAKNAQYDGIKVLPFPHFPVNAIEGQEKKDVLYSFIGCSWTHEVRKKILALPEQDDVVLKSRKNWHFVGSLSNNEQLKKIQKNEKEEYQDVLARTRFSLCPRGTGPSTIRFWESFKSGAIPVMYADAAMLPASVEWDDYIIQIKEEDAEKTDEILRQISPEKEKQLRKNCLAMHERLTSDFVWAVRDYYEQRNV